MRYLILAFFFLVFSSVSAQQINHWETIIYNSDTWFYRIGTSQPPSNWTQASFDDSSWASGQGGFGYADGDDNTLIPPSTLSVCIRKEFEIIDISAVEIATLHADYDDGFVAYLNGVEIARSNNLGTIGVPPPFNETTTTDHEAVLYENGTPEAYSISGITLENLLVQGSNTLAIQTHNVDANSSDFSSNFFFSVGITDTSMNYGETPSWFTSPIFTSNLPILIINTTETNEIFDEPKVPAHLGIIDNGVGQINSVFDNFNNYDGRIAIEIRGASSQLFPKKNYGFETQMENGENNNVSLLGMPAENDWILHGPFADKSLLRNVLAYHMGHSTGRWAPRTRLVELLVNEDYRGVYILTERIKRDANRVDIANLTEVDIEGDELTGGYILQIDRDDESTPLDGFSSNFPDFKFYAYNEPDYEDLMPQQREYIQNYIQDFESALNGSDYLTAYEDFIDVQSWIDYFLVSEIGKHIDAYKLSFYMFKKKESNGGKLNFGPLWDFNLGFGNFDFACSPAPNGWTYEFADNCGSPFPFWVGKITEIPQVSHEINCRWAELRQGAFHTDSLMQFIDDNVENLAEPSERNFNRWNILGEYVWPNDFIGDTYEEEIGFLKTWLTLRLNWMDANMLGDCDSFISNVTTVSKEQIDIYPNPVENELIINVKDENLLGSEIEISGILGNSIQNSLLKSNSNQLNLNNLQSGLYLCTIKKNNEIVLVKKIVKR